MTFQPEVESTAIGYSILGEYFGHATEIVICTIHNSGRNNANWDNNVATENEDKGHSMKKE